MRGNATFTAADLSAGSAGVAALAKKFGGARAIWDAGVCSQTQSHHMCMGPCDAWQPRDPATQRPLLEPVWVYLLTNTDEPSPKVTPRPPALWPGLCPSCCAGAGGTPVPAADPKLSDSGVAVLAGVVL